MIEGSKHYTKLNAGLMPIQGLNSPYVVQVFKQYLKAPMVFASVKNEELR